MRHILVLVDVQPRFLDCHPWGSIRQAFQRNIVKLARSWEHTGDVLNVTYDPDDGLPELQKYTRVRKKDRDGSENIEHLLGHKAETTLYVAGLYRQACVAHTIAGLTTRDYTVVGLERFIASAYPKPRTVHRAITEEELPWDPTRYSFRGIPKDWSSSA